MVRVPCVLQQHYLDKVQSMDAGVLDVLAAGVMPGLHTLKLISNDRQYLRQYRDWNDRMAREDLMGFLKQASWGRLPLPLTSHRLAPAHRLTLHRLA